MGAVGRTKSFLAASALALYTHLGLQLVVGGLLATVYRAQVQDAHASAAALHRGAWAYAQGFHYWGSAVLILHSVLHLVAVTWAGWYRGPQVKGYLAAVGVALISLGFQLTGNLLPWDRHGVQTAAVEGSIAARAPGVGHAVSKAMLGGDGVSPATLDLWYKAHWLILPVALIVVLLLGLSAPRPKGWRWGYLVPAFVALAIAVAVPSPLGSPATPLDYGRFDAKPSWYTLPMHGLLVWGDRLVKGGGWIGAALLPGLFVLALILLPMMKKVKPGPVRGTLAFAILLTAAAAFTSGGRFARLTGSRDPKDRPAVAKKTTERQNTALAAVGRALFRDQGCAGCHGQDGLKGVSGPSLKDVWQEHPDADFYIRYIRAPQSVEKGSTMPAFENLKPDELRALAEFVRFPR